MFWSQPMTAAELAAQRGWKRGEWRQELRKMAQTVPHMVRRLEPIAPMSRKRRVVYQLPLAHQEPLWS